MGESVISVRGVGKRFRIAHAGARATTLAEAVARRVRHPLSGGATNEAFWALKDVSFEVARGEVVGIIGRNGVGKSTLLKILSRIMSPTEGEADLVGRVGSLLEVGTGFHPELTGRENIFLNGAILGMKRSEIRVRFDEIVAFAEIAHFLDTPVKRYSSGMYVRLAFAVAAHLNPEILIVDEVLAVGDVGFQKKCLGKMRSVAEGEGRTVLFVSHSMAAVATLTRRAILLDGGRIADAGPTADVVERYMAGIQEGGDAWTATGRTGHPVQVTAVALRDDRGEGGSAFDAAAGFWVEIDYVVREVARNVVIEFFIMGSDGVHLLTSGDHDRAPSRYQERAPGSYRARIRVPGDLLGLGTYLLKVNCGTHQRTFDLIDAAVFRVVEEHRISSRANRRGLILPMWEWETAAAEVPELKGVQR
jgi:lipopolysaccharide transport system ATP-binding protein